MASATRQRALELRSRVLDCIHDMGHGEKGPGMDRFLDHALWCAKQRDMRLWKSENVRGDTELEAMKRTAMMSLKRLTGDLDSYKSVEGKVVPVDTSRINANWVLDVWEVACDDWFRVKPAKPEEIEQMEELEAASPAATASLVGPAERKLSACILDAYLNRDSDAMLNALYELEQRGL